MGFLGGLLIVILVYYTPSPILIMQAPILDLRLQNSRAGSEALRCYKYHSPKGSLLELPVLLYTPKKPLGGFKV